METFVDKVESLNLCHLHTHRRQEKEGVKEKNVFCLTCAYSPQAAQPRIHFCVGIGKSAMFHLLEGPD